MANRRPPTGRRNDFNRNDRVKSFGRAGVSPWQGGGPGAGLPNLLPLGGGSTEATLALASNIINLLQPRQNPVPSLLDMPIRRDFVPNMGRYDHRYGANRMGNQSNFRRTGNYNRAGERISNNRKPFRPNDGQRQQNKSSPKKEADSKAKPVKESGEEKPVQEDGDATEKPEAKEEGEKKEAPKTRYDDICSQLLHCHICNKSMWDGRSFENHLSGRAHAIMMQKTAESYALTADTMRQEFKIREMKRTRKTGAQPARDFYCAMCDMYAAEGAVHRTTVGHRKLKKYLHPACAICRKEMPTRIELDEHRLTVEHLKMLQDKQENITKPKPEVMVISTLCMEQSYLREDRRGQRQHDRQDKPTANNEQTDKQEGEVKQEQENKGEEDGNKEVVAAEKKETDNLDAENTILDYNEEDDLSEATKDMLPAYSTERGVGKSFLSEFRCVQCKLCRKLLADDETAEVHLRTWRHHQLFTRLITEKMPQKQQDGNKRPQEQNGEAEGDSKRRKTDDEENQHENEDVEMKQVADDVADADLEDWEQSVDDILLDEEDTPEGETKVKKEVEVDEEKKEEDKEKIVEKESVADVKEEKVEKEVIVEKEKEEILEKKSPVASTPVVDNKTRGTPRGRGRGRGNRGRGRY